MSEPAARGSCGVARQPQPWPSSTTLHGIGGGQAPVPLHRASSVPSLELQVASRHTTSSPTNEAQMSRRVPSHTVWLHTFDSTAAHEGRPPCGRPAIAPHVPRAVGVSHASQMPLHRVSQHTPSVQNPVAQSASRAQVSPGFDATHRLSAHACPAAQSAVVAHVVLQAPALQLNPSHVRVPRGSPETGAHRPATSQASQAGQGTHGRRCVAPLGGDSRRQRGPCSIVVRPSA
jgi:hypothetical protein